MGRGPSHTVVHYPISVQSLRITQNKNILRNKLYTQKERERERKKDKPGIHNLTFSSPNIPTILIAHHTHGLKASRTHLRVSGSLIYFSMAHSSFERLLYSPVQF